MRTHAVIDLQRLAANYRKIRAAVGVSVAVLPVVKADAYGHGAVEIARTLSAAGPGGSRFPVSKRAPRFDRRG